jgi:hypothetical protein
VCPYHGYITKFPEKLRVQLTEGDSHGKFVVEEELEVGL